MVIGEGGYRGHKIEGSRTGGGGKMVQGQGLVWNSEDFRLVPFSAAGSLRDLKQVS